MKRDLRSNFRPRLALRARGRTRRPETGDTLIEVLLAVMVMGISSVAILLAFGTSIFGSSEYRGLATTDTVLRTAAEEVTSYLQQQPGLWANCGAVTQLDSALATNVPVPANYTVQSVTATYWSSSQDTYLTQSTPGQCPVGAATDPSALVTITIGYGGKSYSISTVVNDPSAPASPTFGSATQLVFLGQPGNGTAGNPLSTPPEVAVEDGGNPPQIVTTDLSSVQLTLNQLTGNGAALSGDCTGAEIAGVVTFSNCSVNEAGSFTLTATDTELPSATDQITSSAFTISPSTPAQIAFKTVPTSGVGGSSLSSEPQVQVEDAFGDVVTNDSSSLSLTIEPNTGTPGAQLTNACSNPTESNGVFSFPNTCAVTYAGTGYGLVATDGSMTVTSPTTFSVTAGGPAELIFSTQPSAADTTAVNFATQPVVSVADLGGNPVSGSSTVTLSLISSPTNGMTGQGSLTCSGGISVPTSASGKAVFSGCKITLSGPLTGGTFELEATGTSYGSVTSQSTGFTVAATSSLHLQFSPGPGPSTSGVMFSTQPVVEVVDTNNDVVTTSNASISLEDGGAHSGAVTCPGGQLTVAAINGVATFSDCEVTLTNTPLSPITNNEGSFVLEAYEPSGSAVGSTTFPVAGPATQLAFLAWPGSSTSATAFGTQPIVQVEDAANDLVTNSTAMVTLNVNSGAGSLGCPTAGGASIAAVGGIATFAGCEITLAPTNPGGPFKLGASAVVNLATINAPPTQSFTVAGTAYKLVFTTQPSNGTGGVNLPTQPQVSVEDLDNDVVTADSSTVTLSLNSPGAGVESDTCAGTESLGVVSFSGCSVNLAGNGYTFTANDGSLVPATSSPFSITTGTSAQLVFTTSPQGGIAGQAFGVQPVVALEDAGGNLITTGPAKSIALTVTGGAPLACTSNTATTFGGIATFSGCSTTSAGANISLSATASGLPVAISTSFNVSSGPASVLAITSSPVSGQASEQANVGPISLQEQDAYGNPVTVLANGGLPVTLSSSSSAGVFSSAIGGGTPTGPTVTIPYGSSVTTFYYGDTAAGSPIVSASAAGLTSGSQAQTITAAPASQLAIISAPVSGAASATANLGPITVQEQDPYGNPSPAGSGGQTVTLAATGSGTFATSAGGSATTSAVIPAGLTALPIYFGDENVGSQTITASAFGTHVTQSEAIRSSAVSPLRSTVVANPTSVTVSSSTGTTITVTDLDAYGNPEVGDTVTLSAGSGSSLITTVSGTTNSSGVATFTVADTTAQAVTYTATDNTAGVNVGTATVTFVPGAATAANSTVGASPATVNANGTASSLITVTAKDAYGNLVSGDTVTLSAGSGSSLITTSPSTTNASGVATFTVADNAVQSVTYTATVAGLQVTQTATVTFSSDPLSTSNSSATANPTSGVTANGTASSLITVTVKDGSNPAEPIANQNITLTGTGSSVIATSPGTTNANGQVTFTVTDTHAQTVTYTATDTTAGNVLIGSPTVTFVAGPASASASTVVANAATVTASSSTGTTVTVTDLDANDNPIVGDHITLTQGTGSSTITTSPSTTNSSGQAIFTVTDTHAQAVTYTATDTTQGVMIGQTATVTYLTGPVSPATANSTVAASKSPVNANGTSYSTITVTAKDANNNDEVGDTVTLSAGSGSSVITTVSGTTNASGVATFTVADNAVQSVTYTAVVGGVQLSQTATVTFASDPLSTSNSSATANPTSGVTANGAASSLITVTVKDGSNPAEPIANQTITLSAGSGSSLITTVSGTTNSSGVATFTVADTTAQAVTYTATDNTAGVNVGTATVTFVPGAATAANSTVGASPATVNANGTASSLITVTAKDAYGNLVSGDTVTLSAGSGSSLITTVSGTTNASGVATFTVADNAVQSVTYTATVAGLQVTQTATVTFSSDPLSTSNSSATANPTSGVTANGTASSLITVTVKDGSNPAEPIANQNITLTGTGSSVIATSPGTTNANGQVTFTVTDTHAQTVTYTATDTTAGNVLIGSPTVTFVAGPASASASTVVANAATNVTANGTATSTVTVTALDANGNPVANQSVSLAASPSTGSSITTSPVTTNSSGVAQFTVKDTVAGTVTYTATDKTPSTPVQLTQTATVGFVAGPASAATSTAVATPTGVKDNGTAESTIKVTIEDANGNPVAGQNVTLTAGSGSSIISTSPQTTNSLGQATFTVTDTHPQTVTYTATDTTANVTVSTTNSSVTFSTAG